MHSRSSAATCTSGSAAPAPVAATSVYSIAAAPGAVASVACCTPYSAAAALQPQERTSVFLVHDAELQVERALMLHPAQLAAVGQ